jgi:hypothetical protein
LQFVLKVCAALSDVLARVHAAGVARFGSPWPKMVAVNVVIFAATFYLRFRQGTPEIAYLHLLSTYHFGPTRRSFIGAMIALFTDHVSPAMVFGLGPAALLVALALFALVFVRTFGSSTSVLPLAVFVFGSPFLFKNFIFSVGYFDIYGFIVATLTLLLPTGILFMALIGVLCVLLLLIHHLHFLLYLPTIAVVVLIRSFVLTRPSSMKAFVFAIAVVAVVVTFLVMMFWGEPSATRDQWAAYDQSRATAPIATKFMYIWYSNLSEELARSWSVLPKNLLRIPVWVLLILAHYPLIRFLRRIILDMRERLHSLLLIAAIAAISLGYLAIFIVIFDWSRWVSNWFACMIIILHLAAMLPRRMTAVEPIAENDPATSALGWVVTIVPRVGIDVPF